MYEFSLFSVSINFNYNIIWTLLERKEIRVFLKISENDDSIELTVLRNGAITPTQIRQVLQHQNKALHFHNPIDKIEAPGQIKHHYMPSIPLLFIKRENWTPLKEPLEALNKLLNTKFKSFTLLTLSSSPSQAARELYGQLRICSSPPAELIVFIKEPYHKGEDWAGLIDRLNRASSFHILDSI